MQIKNRYSGAVMFECALPANIAEQSAGRQLGYAAKQALSARANLADADLARAYLAGANLAGANLAGANLAGAYLAGADLAGAYLADADLAGAYLADAYLADADLAGADLAGAYLAGANLAGAYLAGADLADANLADADLAGANLAGANLAGAINAPPSTERTDPPEPYVRATNPEHYAKRAERYRARNPDVPVIPDIDRQILGVVESGKGTLNMSAWHECETTHCRAGWAITLAGEKGKVLEDSYGPAVAGRMIYLASTGRAPHFFATNEHALADIRERAAEQI